MYFLETLQVRAPYHGGVLNIDGMLFEFCMNFLSIEKNFILIIYFFNISCFLPVLWGGGGGGGGVDFILFFFAL